MTDPKIAELQKAISLKSVEIKSGLSTNVAEIKKLRRELAKYLTTQQNAG